MASTEMEAARVQFFDVFNGAFAAAEHADFFVSDFCNGLIDIVSKGIVVVDNDDHSKTQWLVVSD